jgi:hypothetical protein
MIIRPLKITFHLDGAGVYYDPAEPIMLDSLIAVACARRQVHGEPPGRDEQPHEFMLPLRRWEAGGTWGWCASALFPDGPTAETQTFWRKRFRQNRVEIAEGSPNLTNGVYRDWNMPLPLLLTHRLVGWCVGWGDKGSASMIQRELRRSIRWLGKKRSHGHGRVVGINVEHTEDDHSIARDGVLMRWMPREEGARLVRPRPPYWNTVGRVRCGEIGEKVVAPATGGSE